MGEGTKIEWCDHTFNPWIGCQKVSAACDHCYAEGIGKRLGVKWGIDGERRLTKTWRDPVRWHKRSLKAKESQERGSVFCGSLCDVFEADDVLDEWRSKLWELVLQTTELDWLLLTKRPQNVLHSVPAEWHENWPSHVAVGTTVEDQPMAERRLPYLCAIPAPMRFVSCEPLLGFVDLTRIRFTPYTTVNALRGTAYNRNGAVEILQSIGIHPIDWVIAGGESGSKARPMHPDWVRSLRDKCQRTQTPFFFKQWGEWLSVTGGSREARHDRELKLQRSNIGGWLWGDDAMSYRVGRKKAGDQLYGVRHHERPEQLR